MLVSSLALNSTSAQVIGGPEAVLFFGVNNSGEVQNGVNGPDNLVLFQVTPIEENDEGDPPEIGDVPVIPFSIVGNITTGVDINGDGVDDSIGTFSGLEWSSGTPGVGTLIGCVLDDGVGNGEVYQINPNTAFASLVGTPPMSGGEQIYFSDLAFNPADGLMYGLVNDITENGNNLDFGLPTIWVDADGDLIPDTQVGSQITICPLTGAPLVALASGMTFFESGLLFVYDNSDEQLLLGGLNSDALTTSPSAFPFDGNETNLDPNETELGNGLTIVDTTVFIATDTTLAGLRSTAISFYTIPPPNTDPPPEVIPAATFPIGFFQSVFQTTVAIGDFVPATADLEGLPSIFPGNIIVNSGILGDNAVLEAVVVSDDFRYCVNPEAPTPEAAPVDLTFVFTIPNSANLTVLGIEIESQANTSNLEHFVNLLNIDTGEFDFIGSQQIAAGEDGTITVDISTNIAQYVDPASGTLTCNIASRPTGPVLFFPWQLKFDSVLVFSE